MINGVIDGPDDPVADEESGEGYESEEEEQPSSQETNDQGGHGRSTSEEYV